MQTITIEREETFFLERDSAKAFFVEKNFSNASQKYYLYELNFTVDLRLIGRTKIDKVSVTLKGNEQAYSFDHEFEYGNIYADGLTATSAVLNSDVIDFTHDVLMNQNASNNVIADIDALQFIDVNRYKNNFRGTHADKYGRIRNIKTYVETAPTKNALPDTFQDAVIEQTSSAVERALHRGVGITKVLKLNKIRKKQPASRHQITIDEQSQNEIEEMQNKADALGNVSTPTEEEVKLMQFLQESIETTRHRAMVGYLDSPMRRVSFLLQIKEDDILNSQIEMSEFFVCLEAKDRDSIKLDEQLLRIDLERDLLMDAVTLSNFSIRGDDEGDRFIVGVDNSSPTTTEMTLHKKSLKKDVPFYKNVFTEIAALSIPASRDSGYFVIPKPNQDYRYSTTRPSGTPNSNCLPMGLSDIPRFYRVTPKIGGLKFDNVYEVGQPPVAPYENRYIPFSVLNNNISSEGLHNVIQVDIGFIPKKYRKLRVLKNDLQKYPYSDSRSLKRIRGPQNNIVASIPITGERALNTDFVNVKDFDVREDAFYNYRLELVDDVGRVGKIYSATFFQERIQIPSKNISLSIKSQSFESGNIFFESEISIQETSTQRVIAQIHPDLYQTFQTEISQISDDLLKSIVVGVERIDVDACTIDFLGYYQDSSIDYLGQDGTSSNTSSATISFSESIPNPNRHYIYKATSYVKPVLQIVSEINRELEARAASGGGSGGGVGAAARLASYVGPVDLESFADIRRKIESTETSFLNSISEKYSSREAKRGLIVDPKTRRDINMGDNFKNASTGNVRYVSAPGTLVSPVSPVHPGLLKLDLVTNTTHQSRNDQNRDINVGIGDTKIKFMITFDAKFTYDVDHCAIFIRTLGGLDFCCNMHVDHEKESYRILIEKNNLRGDVEILMYPISMLGKSKQKVVLSRVVLPI